MKFRKISLITYLIFLSISIFANGGPVNISNFRKTGNIKLMQKADFSLLEEVLNIKIVGDYTYVEVKYRLKNNGKKDRITYGFPVDAFECDWYFGESEGPNPFSWRNSEIVTSFEAYEDALRLKTTSWVHDSLYQVQSYNLNEGFLSDRKYYVTRKWFMLKLDFDSLEEKSITIKYKVENTKRDKLPGFCFIPRYTDRHFTYHLFPSSKWGDGIVKNMQINIDIQDLKENNSQFIVDGLDSLECTETGYKLSMNDYDLTQSDRINITYNNSHLKIAEYLKYNNTTYKVIERAIVSTDAKNTKCLFDGNSETFWTGKVGDWIEITVNKDIYNDNNFFTLGGLMILNGNYSNIENFENSGQIRTCKIIVNDTIDYNIEPWDIENGSKTIKLNKGEYRDVEDISGNSIILADNTYIRGVPNAPTKKIKIIVTSIYPGFNNENTFSISEIYFVGRNK